MLNMLVRRHPRIGRLIPARFENADLEPSYDLVVAMDVPGIAVDSLRAVSRGIVVVTGPWGVEAHSGWTTSPASMPR
jgi:hypothetical protein